MRTHLPTIKNSLASTILAYGGISLLATGVSALPRKTVEFSHEHIAQHKFQPVYLDGDSQLDGLARQPNGTLAYVKPEFMQPRDKPWVKELTPDMAEIATTYFSFAIV